MRIDKPFDQDMSLNCFRSLAGLEIALAPANNSAKFHLVQGKIRVIQNSVDLEFVVSENVRKL